jgi:transposase
MAEKRGNYRDEFKREAVRLVTEHGCDMSKTARNLGINPTMLKRWKREVEAKQHDAFPGNGHVLPGKEALYRLYRFRNGIKWLRMEQDIVKKSSRLLC